MLFYRLELSAITNGVTRTVDNASVDLAGNLAVDDSLVNNPAAIIFGGSGAMTIKTANPTIFVGHNASSAFTGSATLTINQAIGEDVPGRGFTKTGDGTLTLGGSADTYTGDTTLSAGVTAAGTVSIGAILTPFGTGGTLRFAGGSLLINSQRANTNTIPNAANMTADTLITETAVDTTNGGNINFGGPWTLGNGCRHAHPSQ